jgi:Fe-S cluster assembly scaffold protein SufB
MKNVKSAPNYWQIDHKLENISKIKDIIILPSSLAWKKFKWTRSFFEKKPREGYFIWVKKQVDFPLATCITIASPRISQDLKNLLVIEKGIKIRANVVCNAAKKNLCGTHKARGKIILKENASLEYNHLHKWGEKDFVNPEYEFILEKNSHLIYHYKNLFSPANLRLNTTIYTGKNSSSHLNFFIQGLKNSQVRLKDTVFLEGINSQGIVRLRLVGRKNTQLEAISKIVAKAEGKGHLDCQGLLLIKIQKYL